MRTTKFRGYDKESKCWRYGYYFLKEDITLCAIYNSKEQYEKDKEKNEHHLILINGFSDWNMPTPHYQSEVDGKSVSQFIGLYDKNKKEIYEGDIIDCWSDGVNAKGMVKQRNDGLWIIYPAWQKTIMWGLCPNDNNICNVEVIGNFYDNPELIETK